jgi:hypothetical protein
MKFTDGDNTKSTTSAAGETKTEAPPIEVKITPAAFAKGELKHFNLLEHLN